MAILPVPGFQYQTVGAGFAEGAGFVVLEDAEGFGGVVGAFNVRGVEDPTNEQDLHHPVGWRFRLQLRHNCSFASAPRIHKSGWEPIVSSSVLDQSAAIRPVTCTCRFFSKSAT